MSPSPDEATSKTGVAAPDEAGAPRAAETAAPGAEDGNAARPPTAGTSEAEVAPASEPAPAAPTTEESKPAAVAKPAEPQEVDDREPLPRNVLLYTVFGLLCIGIALWLVLAWSGYKDKYSQQTEGWRLGSTKMLEITLIREDKKNLACASDKTFGDIHCGYYRNGSPFGAKPEDDPHILQPFNTVKNELFLAAGLWHAPVLRGTLPAERFTVVCNYHIVGVLKAVALRWSPTGNFGPVDQSVAVGTLSDCTIPQ
ncbi:MAG: hypothetical protein JXP73_02230 [Deltaproteobacteria bacterium]|nr:hypothetical protein [Deltaproteobacteria bacterium]